MYLGNQPALAYTSFAKQDFTTSATTSYTLDNPVANENEIALFINFVRQEPTTAYTASGTSLTLTSATSASDDMYCVFLGKAVQTVNPPAGSVGTSQLASTAVTPAKMDLSQDYTFTGSVSGHNYPAFFAQGDTQQSITQATNTVVTYNQEVYDTDSCYASNVFTPNVAGKYFCYASVPFESNFNADQLLILSKNQTVGNSANTMINYTRQTFSLNVYGSFDMNGTTDNIRVYVFHQNAGSANLNFGGNRQYAHFGAYRIGA